MRFTTYYSNAIEYADHLPLAGTYIALRTTPYYNYYN